MKKNYQSENDIYSWYEFPIDIEQCTVIRQLQPSLQVVTHESFQSTNVSFSLEDIEDTIRQSTTFFLLKNIKDGTIAGFAFIYVIPFQSNDEKLCFINKLAISSKFQGMRFASQFRNLLLKKETFAWIAARTQNPAIMYNFSKNAINVYPFKEAYSGTDDGRKILEFIAQNIPQVKDSFKIGKVAIDITTGICKGYYKGNLGNNYVNKSENFIIEMSQLDTWNFSATNGDAILITSSFKNLN